MKNVRKTTLVFSLLAGAIVILSYCRQDDTILGLDVAATGNELISLPTSTAPTIDGTIDPVWEQATKLNVETKVPNLATICLPDM